MSDYVYLHVKLQLEDGQTEDSIQEIVQDLDYSFDHSQISDYEIVDIVDMNLSENREVQNYVDPYETEEMEHDPELYEKWSE
jgi:hypothetical protein